MTPEQKKALAKKIVIGVGVTAAAVAITYAAVNKATVNNGLKIVDWERNAKSDLLKGLEESQSRYDKLLKEGNITREMYDKHHDQLWKDYYADYKEISNRFLKVNGLL